MRELLRRAARHGPGVLDDLEALGLLLSRLAGPRSGPPCAAALLERYGSVGGVLAADLPRLRGMLPWDAAVGLKLVHDLARRSLEAPLRRRPVVSSSSQLIAYLRSVLAHEAREHFRCLFLDKKNRLIADEVMGTGTVDHAPVYPREIMRRALELSASALIVAHNHPSGDPTPSRADIEMTRKLAEAARALGLVLHDHVVVAAEGSVSLRSRGLI